MPDFRSGGSGGYRFGGSIQDNEQSVLDVMQLANLGTRMRMAEEIAPTAIQDPNALIGIQALAKGAPTDAAFAEQLAQMYGMAEAEQIASDLKGMGADAAYIKFHRLPSSMQDKITKLGFTPQEFGSLAKGGDGTASGIGRFIPVVGEAIGDVTGFVGEEVLSPTMGFFEDIGNASTHAYRALKAVELEQGELAVFNPANWDDGWRKTGTALPYLAPKDRAELRNRYDLTDKQLNDYLRLSTGRLPGELAEDDGFTIGTEEFNQRTGQYYDMLQTVAGQSLVTGGDLQGYRISFGRTVARSMGFSPEGLDEGWGKLVSGTSDLAYALLVDPTLVAGKLSKSARLSRWALMHADDAEVAVKAAMAAKVLEEGGATVQKVGLRTVSLAGQGEYAGQVIDIAKSRLAYGQRVLRSAEKVSKVLGSEGTEYSAALAELVRDQPYMLGALDSLATKSNVLKKATGKGFEDVETLLNFMASGEGKLLSIGTSFGGTNTSAFFRLPEIGANDLNDIARTIGNTEKLVAAGDYAKVQLKKGFTTLVDWGVEQDRKALQAMGVADTALGQVGNILLRPHQQLRRAAMAPAKFAKGFITHVPRNPKIDLWGNAAVEEFERALQQGHLMGIDKTTLDGLRARFVGAPLEIYDDASRTMLAHSVTERARAVRDLNVKLLERFDIGDADPLYRKFVARLDEAYGFTPEGDRLTGLAIVPKQQAGAIMIPQLRDMVALTNRYSVTRAVLGRGGIGNPRWLDSMLSRYWKPSVLMRLGFIGRAGGEEMLGFLARYGSGRYLGIQLEMDAERFKLYDEMLGHMDLASSGGREKIADLLSRTPQDWTDVIVPGTRSFAPGAREVLTWGGSQALAPYTGTMHAFDQFARKVLLNVEDASEIPQWGQRLLERTARWDAKAIHRSIQARQATGALVRKTGGQAAVRFMLDQLDTVLSLPIMRSMVDGSVLKEVLEQNGSTKDMLGRLLTKHTDQDMGYLREMFTDPVVRKAMAEQVGALSVGLPEMNNPLDEGNYQMVARWHDGELSHIRMVTDGNANQIITRPDQATMNSQEALDYATNFMQTVRKLFDVDSGLAQVIERVLVNHVDDARIMTIADAMRAAGVTVEGADDLEQVRHLVQRLHDLPAEHYQSLLHSLENEGPNRMAQLLAPTVTDADHARTLSIMRRIDDRSAQTFLMHPRIKAAKVTNAFEAVEAELRTELAKLVRHPAAKYHFETLDAWARALASPPVDGMTPAYGIMADQATAKALTIDLQNLDQHRFIEEMSGRLATLGYDDPRAMATAVLDELRNPDVPIETWQHGVAATENGTLVPISMATSSDDRIMEALSDQLDAMLDRKTTLVRADHLDTDVPTHRGESAMVWTGQPTAYAHAMPVPRSKRQVLIEGPDPAHTVASLPYGPPDPVSISRVTPTQQTVDLSSYFALNEDIAPHALFPMLPDRPGHVTMVGIGPVDGPPVVWYEPQSLAVDEVWNGVIDNFADTPELGYHVGYFPEQMIEQYLDDESFEFIQRYMEEAGYQRFAIDGERVVGIDPSGNIETDWGTTVEPFTVDGLQRTEGFAPGLSTPHFVDQYRDELLRMTRLGTEPLTEAELTDDMRYVARQIGVDEQALTGTTTNDRILRMGGARKSHHFLLEGEAQIRPGKTWHDEDALAQLTKDLGGPWTPQTVDRVLQTAIDSADEAWWQAYQDASGTLVEELNPIRDALETAKAHGGALTPEAVSARNNVVSYLDQLVPNWRGAMGWNRPGTKDWFGVDGLEPTRTGGKRVLSSGTTQAAQFDQMVEDIANNLVRNFSSAQSGSQLPPRVLHEILTPLAVDGPKEFNLYHVLNGPSINDLPLSTAGQRYVVASESWWNRLTNFWFDDVVSDALGAMVRNPLFAQNYIQARRLTEGLAEQFTNYDLLPLAKEGAKNLALDPDAIDEMIELERHGLLHVPELNDTSVQSLSAVKLPRPNMTQAEANKFWRNQLMLKDTPLSTRMSEAMSDAASRIGTEVNDKAYALRRQLEAENLFPEEITRRVEAFKEAEWARRNPEVEAAGEAARLHVEQLRSEGVALRTERTDLVEPGDEIVHDLTAEELDAFSGYIASRTNALDMSRDAALGRAMQGTIPYIDDHRLRSQFQEYVGNIVPFWFAEEQFLKRWARIIKESPETVRKGQLLMHGLRHSGFAKEDADGNLYFIYPGGSLVADVLGGLGIDKLLFGGDFMMPQNLALTGDVMATLPGFNGRAGVPVPGPMVGVTMELLADRFPELAETQELLMGGRGSNRSVSSYFIPTSLQRFTDLFTKDIDEGQFATAAIQTAQVMVAAGKGPDAFPDQQAFLDQVEVNTRTVMLSRAILGFAGPASPQISTELPLAEEFQNLVNSGMDYTEALAKFAEYHDGDLSPYTVFKTEVPSNAPITATDESLLLMDEFADELRLYPLAAPWMVLPMREAGTDDEFSNRAWRLMLRQGLRKRRNLSEYIDALAFADASPKYFDQVELFDARIEALRANDMPQAMINQVELEKMTWTKAYKNMHPSFAQQLNTDNQNTRQQILREAYLLMDSPSVADLERVAPMREMLVEFQRYQDQVQAIGMGPATKVAQQYKQRLSLNLQSFLGFHLMDHPELRYFYDRVIRPELDWDQGVV